MAWLCGMIVGVAAYRGDGLGVLLGLLGALVFAPWRPEPAEEEEEVL